MAELCSLGLLVKPDAVQQAQALAPDDSSRTSRMPHLGKVPLGSPQPQHTPRPLLSPYVGESQVLSCTHMIAASSVSVSQGQSWMVKANEEQGDGEPSLEPSCPEVRKTLGVMRVRSSKLP